MEHNAIIGWIPWPVATATAVWFGVMAHRAAKNTALWALGGGMLGLVVTTLVLGLGQATFIPFYHAEIHLFRVKIAVLAILLVAGIGWLFTGSLHRKLSESFKLGEAPGPEAPPKSPTAVPKPQLRGGGA